MSADTINTRHTLTGKVQRVTADQLSVFPDYLEVVEDDAKPLLPGMFKPGKVGDKAASRTETKASDTPTKKTEAVKADDKGDAE